MKSLLQQMHVSDGRISVVQSHFPAEAIDLADKRNLKYLRYDLRIIELTIQISRLVKDDNQKKELLNHLKANQVQKLVSYDLLVGL